MRRLSMILVTLAFASGFQIAEVRALFFAVNLSEILKIHDDDDDDDDGAFYFRRARRRSSTHVTDNPSTCYRTKRIYEI